MSGLLIRISLDDAGPGESLPPGTAVTRVEASLPSHLERLEAGPVGGRGPLDLRPLATTGDRDFDRKVAVRGPDLVVAAALGEAARTYLIGLVSARGGRVRDGFVTVTLPGHATPVNRVEDHLGLVAHVARTLGFAVDATAERLGRIVRTDALVSVRQRALARLLEHFPRDSVTQDALGYALGSDSVALRVTAAAACPERGPPALRALLSGADRCFAPLDGPERARALGLLVGLDRRPEEVRALRSLLWEGDVRSRLAAAEALADVAGPEAAAELFSLSQRMFTPPELRRAAARALDRVRLRVGTELEGALSLCPAAGALSLANDER